MSEPSVDDAAGRIEVYLRGDYQRVDRSDLAILVSSWRAQRAALAIHPFIEGLLKTLPETGKKWGLHERVKWLTLAENAFDLIYESDHKENPDERAEHR